MFCPQCKAEYRVGFIRCSDCGVELVDHLPVNAPTEKDQPDLVVLRTYQSGLDANLAKSVLEAAGIPSLVRGDDGRRYYYSYGLAFHTGIELLVRTEDVEDAEKILAIGEDDSPKPHNLPT